MTFSEILLLLIMVALFEHNSTIYVHNGLVYNGMPFKSKEYPYVMYIQINKTVPNEFERCTGTLIKKLLVLTAAHCCVGHDATDIKVCQGSRYFEGNFGHATNWHYVVKIYVHENYHGADNEERDDVCVLKLEKAFPNIKKFSKIGGSPDDFKNGKKLSCKIIGFGAVADVNDDKDNGMFGRVVKIDVLHGKTACKKYDIYKNIQKAWEQHLCLVQSDSRSCEGDSGGPMICNDLQYGTCAFKYTTDGTDNLNCSNFNTQSIYMFLHYHREWLNNIMDQKKKDGKKKKDKKRKRSSGNLLKARHYSLYIIFTILLCNMLTFI